MNDTRPTSFYVGKWVKVLTHSKTAGDPDAIWMKVFNIHHGQLVGTTAMNPVYPTGSDLGFGSTLRVPPQDVVAVWSQMK